MTKLSKKETLDGVLNGSIDKVSRTDALAMLKELGFKDASLKDAYNPHGKYSGAMIMKHKDVAAFVAVTRDAFLKEAQLLEFRTAVSEVLKQPVATKKAVK